MFAKSINEPIDDRSNLNKHEGRNGKFIATDAVGSVACEPAEEVFNFYDAPVENFGESPQLSVEILRHDWTRNRCLHLRTQKVPASKSISAATSLCRKQIRRGSAEHRLLYWPSVKSNSAVRKTPSIIAASLMAPVLGAGQGI
ncbi:MAG: hypothetical protein ABSF76_15620 [Opitutaceae bacterium]